MTTLQKAISIAADAHASQARMTGEPYIFHPIAVCKILDEWGMDDDTLTASILHDTLEDSTLTAGDLEQEFGKDVTSLVAGVTKLGKTRAHMDDLSTYHPQTPDNLVKLLIATGQDIRVLIIKLADRLHNLRSLSALPPDKQKKIARESLEVFAPLADRLQMGSVRSEIADISFSYLDKKRYDQLKNLLDTRVKEGEKELKKIEKEVEQALAKEKLKCELSGRAKSVHSLHRKLQKYDNNINCIYDLIALRIIVDDVTDCYLTLGLVHSLYTPMALERIKDYIAVPKQNGYQSIHTTVITPSKQIVEFQIRTHQMHDYAERGLAASFFYNEQKLTDAYKKGQITHLPTNLLWITELQEASAKLREGKKIDTNKLKLNLFADKIFLYTPKGDIVDLPKGALPLDFAYRLHSEIGAKATGVKINGKIAKLNTKLKDGDVVEILISKNPAPKESWLPKLFTSHARQKLRQQLNRSAPK